MASEAKHAVIGNPNGDFWLHHTEHGFDLTHPPTPASPRVSASISFDTQASRVTVDPAKTALVIIDMQNFFLSPHLGRPKTSNGLSACEQLLKFAIPACREAGIQIIWLNWGLTDEELKYLPPATMRSFGFESIPAAQSLDFFNGTNNVAADMVTGDDVPKGRRQYKGPGCDVGMVEIDEGILVDGGRLLMRDQWNSALYPPLEQARKESLNGKAKREDVWIHKNRMSGLWGTETACTQFLDKHGIRTLLFAGVNTDQCVGGSLQDAVTKGYDCLLLSDGSGTTSPPDCQSCIEFNAVKTWGFVLSCRQLAEGVQSSKRS